MAIIDHKLSLTAGNTQQFQSAGSYLRIREAASPVFLVIDNSGNEFEREKGEQMDTASGSILVSVRSLVDQNVEITSSTNSQFDNRNQLELPVNVIELIANDNNHLPAVVVNSGMSIMIAGANPERRCLRVSLPYESAGFITIGKTGVSATNGGLLDVGQTDYIETTGELYAFNPNTQSVTVYVMELNKI